MPVELELTDLCPDGTEHRPVVETEELSTEFWGVPLTTVKVTITCAKCGQPCRTRFEEEDEACNN
jgi:hypothetical protein